MTTVPEQDAPEWTRAHLQPGEAPRWWGRPTAAGVAAVALSGALTVTVLVGSFLLGFDAPGLVLTGAPALSVAVAGALFETGRRVARLLRTSYVVTEERLYVITSRFTTDVQSVPLERLARVEVRQSPLGRALGYWTLRVRAQGANEKTQVSIRAVRDGAGLADELARSYDRTANLAWLRQGG